MVGLHLGQLFLRIGLGVTFVIAGLAKVLPNDPYSGADAAALANMGVFTPKTPGGGGGAGEGEQNAPSNSGNATQPTSFRWQEANQPETPARTTRPRANQPSNAEPEVRSLTPRPETAQPEASQPEATTPAPSTGGSSTTTQEKWKAEDFPDPVELPRVYQIALMLKRSAHPAANEEGKVPMALVPTWAADTRVPGLGMATPVVLAWMAAIAEVVGGGMLLVGFMSRLWALGIVGVMGTAIWLTTIGPAMQTGKAFLGFLPNHGDVFQNTEPYMIAFFQLSLLCMAFSVMFAGPGAISIDGILFGGKDDNEGGE